MIAVPITASTTREAIKDMREASALADLIELRLDFIKNISKNKLKKLLKDKRKKIIVTDRKKRLNLIKKAIELKADFIDLDISIGEKNIKKIINLLNSKNSKGLEKSKTFQNDKNKTKIIVSYHNFKRTNKKEINDKFKKIKKLNPNLIKIVTLANSIDDNLIIFNLIKLWNSKNSKGLENSKNFQSKSIKQRKKIIAFCMGEKGEISRILSPLFGGFLTFGSLKEGKESAPGQITAKTLKNIYRINKLKGKRVKIYGLVGNPVAHSKGFLIHNKAFEKLKLNSIYLNFLVDDLKSFIKNFRNITSGLSITIPFKREIIKYLDKVDPIAKDIGAVNTVINVNGKLIGYNTDYIGAIKAIKQKTIIKNKKIILIGAGGAARAIAYGIKKEGGILTILNRTVSKAEKLAKELKCEFKRLNEINNIKNVDILINATSIGMWPNINKSPVKNKKVLKNMLVFDTIYNPIKTKLLKEAKANGCKTIAGIEMFINQAATQFELFTGKKAPINIMRKAL